jgi:hypothetical protein
MADERDEQELEFFSAVGELVLWASKLDEQMIGICISLLMLGDSRMLPPVLASLDPARKLDMLKARGKLIEEPTWRSKLLKYVEAVEAVNRVRNIACHSVFRLRAGSPVLVSIAAAKIFRGIDLKSKSLPDAATLESLHEAIGAAEEAFQGGKVVLKNLQRVEREHQARTKDRGPAD